ncbi:hypothetical protein N182_05575 [Sinorhizobium sp. GL2]|nr:hypothetical protein N182_05575 [Sinorhizobium sp. GL2]
MKASGADRPLPVARFQARLALRRAACRDGGFECPRVSAAAHRDERRMFG